MPAPKSKQHPTRVAIVQSSVSGKLNFKSNWIVIWVGYCDPRTTSIMLVELRECITISLSSRSWNLHNLHHKWTKSYYHTPRYTYGLVLYPWKICTGWKNVKNHCPFGTEYVSSITIQDMLFVSTCMEDFFQKFDIS